MLMKQGVIKQVVTYEARAKKNVTTGAVGSVGEALKQAVRKA